MVARERYSAFGERRRGETPVTTDQLYTGQRYNFLSGLYHYSDGKGTRRLYDYSERKQARKSLTTNVSVGMGRFYDPLFGRFIQADPIVPDTGSQNLNRYSYVKNSPLVYTDPNGHCGPLTPVCLFLILGGMSLAIQDEMQTPGEPAPSEDSIRSQQIGGGMIGVGGVIWGGMAAAGIASPAAPSVWQLPSMQRGWQIQHTIQRNLPGQALPANYPVADHWNQATGHLTSIKSLDLAAQTYQNTAAITQKVSGYIKDLATFQGRRWGGVNIQPNQIVTREVILAIPPGASPAQLAAIAQLQQAAAQVGVTLTTMVVQ